MSADNFLGIYRVNNRKYVAHNCWSECEKGCSTCEAREIFTARGLKATIELAEDELRNGIYEYGIRFLNGV